MHPAQQHPQVHAATHEDNDLLQLLEGFLGDDFVDADGFESAPLDLLLLAEPLLAADNPTPSGRSDADDQQLRARPVRARRQPQPSRKSDPNKARNERKQELAYLHRKVGELEAQLRGLRAAPAAESLGRVGSSAPSPRLVHAEEADAATCRRNGEVSEPQQLPLAQSTRQSTRSADAAVWQELVERQRELRTQSEKENVRLRLVLETQLKVVQSLEKMLLKPAATRELEKSLKGDAQLLVIVSPDRPLPPDPTSDARVFDELLAGVTQSYAEIDALFRANGLAHKEAAFSDARVRRDGRGELLMEICANKVLPFDVRATGDAVWHHFVFGKEKVPFRFHTDNAPKVFLPTVTSYLKDFGLEVHAKHKSASFRIKQVIRQHAEPERTVIVWCAAIDPVAFSAEPLPGYTGIVEKGYIVLKPSARGAGDTSALTLLQMCHVITPNLRARKATSSAFFRVGALTDFVLSATASNITTSYHIVEDMLLEQSAKPHTPA